MGSLKLDSQQEYELSTVEDAWNISESDALASSFIVRRPSKSRSNENGDNGKQRTMAYASIRSLPNPGKTR
jgi:hypothetical protein